MDDIKPGLRRLMKQPGVTIASIVTLAFSIGAGAATWSLLSALLLDPLPVRDADRLVVLGTPTSRIPGTLYEGFIYPIYPRVRDNEILESVAATWPSMGLLVGSGDQRAEAAVAFATHDLFHVLGITVPIGRTFSPEDDRRGAPIAAILSDHYWRRSFAAASDIIGRRLMVAGKSATVVGVATRGFRVWTCHSRPTSICR
jgi:putative ABC transport system permease protein